MAKGQTVGTSRREEYAEVTKRAILAAARQLFSERGYFATKVDDIAALARVAPATVYAVSGGKHGLLRVLADTAATDSIIETTIRRIEELEDPAAIVALVAATARDLREQFGDVLRVLLGTAPHDKTVCESLANRTIRYRKAFVPIARRLADLRALQTGIDVEQAVDIFWFYFGYSGLFTLHDENGWSYERAERWLCAEASRALLRDSVASVPAKRAKWRLPASTARAT
jgi:AcrR family transcriptional regulator